MQSAEEIIRLESEVEKALDAQDYNRAVTLLNDIIVKAPDHSPAYAKMGSILMQTDTPRNALPYLNKALELDQNNIENLRTLGKYYKKTKEYLHALNTYEKLLELSPMDEDGLYSIFRIYCEVNDVQKAMTTIKQLIKIFPRNASYKAEYAKLLNNSGKKDEALEIYKNLVCKNHSKISDEVFDYWYEIMVAFGQIKEAHDCLLYLTEKYPKSIELKILIAMSYERLEKHEKSIETYQEALELDPKNSVLLYNIGVKYSQLGKSEKAIEYYKLSIKENPLNIVAISALGKSIKYTFESEHFQYLNFALCYLPELAGQQRAVLHNAAGKAFDDLEMYNIAFEHYRKSGILHSEGRDKKARDELQALVTAIEKVFPDAATVSTFSSRGHFDSRPVFIVGIPRSGTTLTEQVLSKIAGVYGAGELRYIPDVLQGIQINNVKFDLQDSQDIFSGITNPSFNQRGAKYLELASKIVPENALRIIDKLPQNFQFLGLIHIILPQARFIHIRRHPVETCLSAYRLLFPDGHYWSDDLQAMGQYYHLYTELMAWWKKVLPENIMLEIRYEDLVNDLEGTSKQMAEHLDVEWTPDCLSFHKNEKIVKTASMDQVRQPIYKTSMNRWRKYEQYLQPLLHQIGDLVDEYERQLADSR